MILYTVYGEGWCDLFGPATETRCRQWINTYTKGGDWGNWCWLAIVDTETEETLESFERDCDL